MALPDPTTRLIQDLDRYSERELRPSVVNRHATIVAIAALAISYLATFAVMVIRELEPIYLLALVNSFTVAVIALVRIINQGGVR